MHVSYGVASGAFTADAKPPNIKRPIKVEELAPGYKRVHEEARERLRTLKPIDLEKEMQFFGSTQTVSALLLEHHVASFSSPSRTALGPCPTCGRRRSRIIRPDSRAITSGGEELSPPDSRFHCAGQIARKQHYIYRGKNHEQHLRNWKETCRFL